MSGEGGKPEPISERKQPDNVTAPDRQRLSEFVCPDCGRRFDSESSLKGHRLRAHGVPMEAKARPPEVREEAAKPQVPDALTQLRNFLTIFGLSEKDANAVCKYMEAYDVNDLVTLNRALIDIGHPLNRRRLLIESWANARGLVIPHSLRRELGLEYRTYRTETPTPSVFGPETEAMVNDLRRLGFRIEHPLQPRPEATSDLVSLVKVILEKAFPSNPSSEIIHEKIAKLERENEEFRKRMELEDAINPIKEDLKSLKDQVSSVRQTTDFQTELVRQFFETVRDGLNIYRNVVERVIHLPSPLKRTEVGSATSLIEKFEAIGGEVE